MAETITYTTVTTVTELQQILALQQNNLPKSVSEFEKNKEGFVTVVHTLDILTEMNTKCAHIIAKSSEKVIAYALCMHPDFKDEIAALKPMFTQIERSIAPKTNYMVMGQICVAKDFRKKGVFRQLYQYMADSLAANYDCIVTEIAIKNTRSINAHYAIGFEKLKTYLHEQQEWEIVSLKTI